MYFNFRYPGIGRSFPRSQRTARGFRKQHFIEVAAGDVAPQAFVPLPHHVPQQQHCLRLVCSMAAPSARSDAILVSEVRPVADNACGKGV